MYVDKSDALKRARLSLDGLSVGDALGEQFFREDCVEKLASRRLPEPYWFYTDDTEMALAIIQILETCGSIDQDKLAMQFAKQYRRNPRRGYGATAHKILSDIYDGIRWQTASGRVFDGKGSMGNGSAMRVAPIGAYFADDYAEVVRQARLSAEVTHNNPEGIAGAIAVAVGAAWAARTEQSGDKSYFDTILALTPESQTREGIEMARIIPAGLTVETAVRRLGNGSRITAPDTVPLTLWLANRHLSNYEEAIWSTIGAWGDIDTNCAIVGGIVALKTGREGIPWRWLDCREELT